MDVSILDTKEILYEKSAVRVVLPTVEGELCVLDMHENFLSRLKNGIITINDSDSFSVTDGVASMENNRLTILVER
ncbi:MAG: F0F1 ATP synthase subunit epsilon [PVC group bacterium]|nr:F0F1 ATP synthase subunit epsilon [PVC group bacterium]